VTLPSTPLNSLSMSLFFGWSGKLLLGFLWGYLVKFRTHTSKFITEQLLSCSLSISSKFWEPRLMPTSVYRNWQDLQLQLKTQGKTVFFHNEMNFNCISNNFVLTAASRLLYCSLFCPFLILSTSPLSPIFLRYPLYISPIVIFLFSPSVLSYLFV
jgi:hypothetical protein